MSRLQETYNELQVAKHELRDLNKMLKDELASSAKYQELVAESKVLREQKKSIENDIKSNALKDAQRMDDLKLEIASLNELLSDLSLNMYIAKETVEIMDEANQRWVPSFKVAFKKD
ncbi:hypothetical protein HOI83_04045 [Candidatus Uhrbacteria bacterium]|jgi:hypothetical protein|nr:hypothetical protein [Candidatus Uhrbacteria bacterium]